MKNLYEESGVKEYWIVNPMEENILIFVLENGSYRSLKPVVDDFAISKLFPEITIHTDEIFK